jgi:hypothetical protein
MPILPHDPLTRDRRVRPLEAGLDGQADMLVTNLDHSRRSGSLAARSARRFVEATQLLFFRGCPANQLGSWQINIDSVGTTFGGA